MRACGNSCPVIVNTQEVIEKYRTELRHGIFVSHPHCLDMIKRGEALLGNLALECDDGPLSMAAKRDGTRYVVTVCTSNAVPEETHEPVFTRRERTEAPVTES